MEMEKQDKGAAMEESESLVRPEGMSKNQWKKLLRKKKYEEGRPDWRKRQKEKEKEKKRKRREEGIIREPPQKKQKMSDSTASPIRVAIELGYQDLMTDQDIRSLMKQCQRCYSANRRAAAPLQLYFTSFNGRFRDKMEDTVPDHIRWDVHFKSGDYVAEFGAGGVVFLAAESPNILTDLAPDKVYVIGGLVDHNHHKGHCYENALSKGVSHAQLPISEHIALRSRKVLAVNHVFEILMEFVQHKDWRMALEQVIPLRKQASNDPSSTPHPPQTSSPPTSTTSVSSENSSQCSDAGAQSQPLSSIDQSQITLPTLSKCRSKSPVGSDDQHISTQTDSDNVKSPQTTLQTHSNLVHSTTNSSQSEQHLNKTTKTTKL